MADQRIASRTVAVMASLAAIIALAGAAGWVFDVEFLRTFHLGSSMKPNTALGVFFCGASLWLIGWGSARALTAARVAAGLAGFIGVGTLVAHVAAWPLTVDQLLWHGTQPLRMSPASATCLTLTALELLITSWNRHRLWVQVCAALTLLISCTAFVAYTYGLSSLFDVPFLSTTAMQTSLSFSVLAMGVLLHTREGPLTRPFTGSSAAATLGRRLGLAVLVVPWCLAYAVSSLSMHFNLELRFATALLGVLTMLVLLVVVAWLTLVVWRHEQDFGITLDSIGDGVLLTDAQGRVVRLNPVAQKLTGWSVDEARGVPADQVFNIINETTRGKVVSPVDRVLREGVVVGLANHTLLIDRAGVERPIADSGAPVRAPDGTLQGVVMVFRDMTGEAESRRQLERTAANLKSVMDANPVGLMALREGVVVYANPATASILGFERVEQVLGQHYLDLLPADDQVLARRRVAEWNSGQVPEPRRLRFKGPQGERLVDSQPLPSAVELDGRPAALTMLSLVSDLDGLEHRMARQTTFAFNGAELSRALAEARFDLPQILNTVARLVSNSPEEVSLVRLWSKDNTHMSASLAFHAQNPQLLELAQRFNTPSRTAGLNALLLREGKALILTRESVRQNASPEALATLGDAIPNSLALVPMRAGGQVLGLLAIARFESLPFDDDDLRFLQDMGDRAGQAVLNARLFDDATSALEASARAAEALRSTEAQLRHSQKLEALGQLAGGIAHDFNNLLSVILGLSTILLEHRDPNDPETADLADIKAAGERAADLTRQLLAFSRKQVMQFKPIDLNQVVKENERIFARLLGEDVSLSFVLGEGLGVVNGDASLLTQVMMNLVVNARDAMPRGGRLVVSTARRELQHSQAELPAGSYVTLSVQDEGVGMTPDVKEHLFEPFFTTKARGKGTGLGLSTSYGIARQSGGTITAETQLGQGSTFTLWLPAFAGMAASSAVVERAAGERGVVLLVEDEPRVREVVQRMLERAGYELHVAGNAEEALKLAPSLGPIDVLLTDVVMPGRSGRELADELLVQRPTLAVVFMSGYTEDAMVQRGVQHGEMTLLQKPFTPAALIAAVAQAAAKRR